MAFSDLVDAAISTVPRFHCTGPVHVWIRITMPPAQLSKNKQPEQPTKRILNPRYFSGNPEFLGTCEQHPVEEEEVINLPVFDDKSMSASPRDREYAGSNQTIVLPLNRFRYSVLNKILAFPQNGRGSSVAGKNGHMDRGSLILGQFFFFEMWLVNTFHGTKNWQSYKGMPKGTYYPYCNLIANNTPKQGGGNTQIRMLAVQANWGYDTTDGTWLLKSTRDVDFDILGLK